jgi:uncharacterized protein YbjT (DUF2867 family)
VSGQPAILLTAANGRTGRAVVAALAAGGLSCRVFIRDPAQWPALQALGATSHAVGDMADPQSIVRALEGVHSVIFIGPPMHPDEATFVGNFLAAAQRANLRQFLYYSVMHPLRRDVRHHGLKLDAEQHIIESGVPYSILQPIRYMQHLEGIWKTVISDGVHAMPFNVEAKFNVVDLVDLAEATARVAATTDYLYGTYELAGPESLSQADMARIISQVIGKPVHAEQVPIKTLRDRGQAAGLSTDRIEQMSIMNQHYDAYGFAGNPAALTMILGRPPSTFRNYVERLIR